MLNKKQFIDKVAEKLYISRKDAVQVVDAVLEAFTEACVNDGGVQFTGVVSVAKKLRKGRTCKNPATGDTIHTEDSYTLSIKTGKSLKEKLNG